jgi:hypothetical protein
MKMRVKLPFGISNTNKVCLWPGYGVPIRIDHNFVTVNQSFENHN